MNLFAYLSRQRAISKRRKQLKELDKWIVDLEDQVHSGQVALQHARRRKSQLEAQLGLLLPVEDIIGIGA